MGRGVAGKPDFTRAERRPAGGLAAALSNADGLLLTEGEQWRRARRIMAPLFTPAHTARTAEAMDRVCRRRVEGWRLQHGARVLNIDSEMSGLTFDILSATLFSDDLDGLNKLVYSTLTEGV